MAFNVTLNGVVYSLPSPGDNNNWATNPPTNNGLNAYLTALANLMASGAPLTTAGGALPLTTALDLGASFGLKALYHQSESANPAASGIVRLANADAVAWRNAGNTADLPLGVATTGLTFNGGMVTGHPQATCSVGSPIATSFATGTTTVVGFSNTELDTDSAVSGSGTTSWKFTCPTGKGGLYEVQACVTLATAIASGTTALYLYKNGSLYRNLFVTGAALAVGATLAGATSLVLSPTTPDYIDIRFAQASGSSVSLNGGAGSTSANWVTIKRVAS